MHFLYAIRKCNSWIWIIIKGVLYISKQWQAFRGYNETSINRGNFMELVKLFSEDDVDLQKHLKNKTSNYTCHVISILT